jgi:hypothetical protein
VEVVRAGEPVFIQLISRQAGWEMFDGRGMHISKDCVRLDPLYRGQEAIERAVLGMVTRWREFEETAEREFSEAARTWRIQKRQTELAIVKHEWDRGNRIIFRPGFNADNIADALRYVEEQNARGRNGAIPANFVGRPPRRHIRPDVVVESDEDPEIPAAQENQARMQERRIQEAFEMARKVSTRRAEKATRAVRRSEAVKKGVREHLRRIARRGLSIALSSSSSEDDDSQ